MGVYADKLVKTLQDGNTLRAAKDDTPDGIKKGGLMFWFEPSGKRARCDAAKEVIARGLVEPLRDGLFDDTTQSWRLAQN